MLNKRITYSKGFLATLILTLLFFVVNFLKLNHSSMYLDEAYSLFYTQQNYDGLSTIFERESNPPLYYLTLHYWGALFGYTVASGRILSLIFMSILLLVSTRWLIKQYHLTTGFFYGILFISSSFVINYALEIRGFSMTALFFLLSCIFLFRLRESNKIWDAFLLTLFASLSFYGHLVSIFGLFILFAFLLFSRVKLLHKTLPIILFSLSTWPILKAMSVEKLESSSMWLAPPAPATAWLELAYFFDNQIFLWCIIVGMITALTVIVLQIIQKQLDRRLFILFSMSLGAWILCYIGSQFVPTFFAKYLLYSIPLFFMVLAITFFHLTQRAPKSSMVQWSIIGIFFFFLFPRINSKPIKGEDWKPLVDFTKSKQKEGYFTVVSPTYMHRPFAYYYDREIFADTEKIFPKLYENDIAFMKYVDDGFFEHTHPEKIILVQSHDGVADPKHKSLHLLYDRYQFVEMKEFQGIKAYCFESDN